MAIERKIVSVSVERVSDDPAYVYETAIEAALEAVLPGADGWSIVNVEKRESGGKKDSYMVWAEKTV